MEKNFKIGVIGAGFMASAIINGMIASQIIDKNKIICSDINQASLEKHSMKGINVTVDNGYLADNSDYILFAVKPQSLTPVFESIKKSNFDKVITIVAGTTKSKFKNNFPNIKVARCMPNTPCAINSGAIGLDISDFDNKEDIDFVKSLFNPLGEVVFVNEDKLDVVTSISGSSPAYFYLFVKSLVDSAIKRGLNENDAKKLIINTMIGSGKMILKNSEKSLDDLITAVCSKGGTTIEAMNVFFKNNFSDIIDDAVEACVKRAKELEKL